VETLDRYNVAGHARHADRHAQIQYILYTTYVRSQVTIPPSQAIPPRPTNHTHTLTHATGAPPRGHHQHANITRTHTQSDHAISARTPTPLSVCGKNCRSTSGGKEGRPIVVLKNGYTAKATNRGREKKMKDRMRPDSHDAHTHTHAGKARQGKARRQHSPSLPIAHSSSKPKMPHPRHEEGMYHG